MKINLLLFLILITACSSLPKIESDFDKNYDLSSYKTYSIEEPELKDLPSQISLNPILIQRIKRAIDSNLTSSGLFYSSDPDLVIRFFIGTAREINRSYDMDPGFYGRRYSGADQRFTRVDRDGISLRFHDSKTNEVIWYAFSRFNRSKSINDQLEIDKFMDRMISKFLSDL